jgi:acetolactate synthase small subunit
MKNLFLSLFFLISQFAHSQIQQNKQQDISTLMQLMKIEPTMKGMVENGIELIKKQKPAVPQQIWNSIKTSVDYKPYVNRVEQIFDANYTQAEIKNLIAEVKANPKKMPLFKQIVQQQLYDAGKQFGKNYANSIKQTLTAKRY